MISVLDICLFHVVKKTAYKKIEFISQCSRFVHIAILENSCDLEDVARLEREKLYGTNKDNGVKTKLRT